MSESERIADYVMDIILYQGMNDHRGTVQVAGNRIKESSSLEPHEINAAVETLQRRGDIKVEAQEPTAPYSFRWISPTLKARARGDTSIGSIANQIVSQLEAKDEATPRDLEMELRSRPYQLNWSVQYLAEIGQVEVAWTPQGNPFIFGSVRLRSDALKDMAGSTNGAVASSTSAEEAPVSRAAHQMIENAQLRSQAALAVEEAIRALEDLGGEGIEGELISATLVDELRWVQSVLNLETESLQEILDARSSLRHVTRLVDRARAVFERHGGGYIVGLLSNVTILMGQALVG